MKFFDVLCLVVGLSFLIIAFYIVGRVHGMQEVIVDRCEIACGGKKYTKLYTDNADWRKWYCSCLNAPESP